MNITIGSGIHSLLGHNVCQQCIMAPGKLQCRLTKLGNKTKSVVLGIRQCRVTVTRIPARIRVLARIFLSCNAVWLSARTSVHVWSAFRVDRYHRKPFSLFLYARQAKTWSPVVVSKSFCFLLSVLEPPAPREVRRRNGCLHIRRTWFELGV